MRGATKTRRDTIEIDVSDWRRPVALVPLTDHQLEALEAVLKTQMMDGLTETNQARRYAALLDMVRAARMKVRSARQVGADEHQPQVEDTPLHLANRLVRLIVDRLSPRDVQRLLETDERTANKVHSMLRDARVAP